MKDKKEYDKLVDLQNALEYYEKIVRFYGYDPYTRDYDLKKFPIIKEDKQKNAISKDFKNYFQALEEYNEYLKELIKKYDIKPTGNLVQRLIFNIQPDDNDNFNSRQQNCDFVIAVLDFQHFS